ASDFGRFRIQAQAHVDRNIDVLEENGMHIWHIASVLPAVNTAESRAALGNLIDSENGLHSADQVHEQVTRNAGSIFLPATPTCKGERIERLFRRGSEP